MFKAYNSILKSMKKNSKSSLAEKFFFDITETAEKRNTISKQKDELYRLLSKNKRHV